MPSFIATVVSSGSRAISISRRDRASRRFPVRSRRRPLESRQFWVLQPSAISAFSTRTESAYFAAASAQCRGHAAPAGCRDRPAAPRSACRLLLTGSRRLRVRSPANCDRQFRDILGVAARGLRRAAAAHVSEAAQPFARIGWRLALRGRRRRIHGRLEVAAQPRGVGHTRRREVVRFAGVGRHVVEFGARGIDVLPRVSVPPCVQRRPAATEPAKERFDLAGGPEEVRSCCSAPGEG